MKIGQYLTKLCAEHSGFTFLAHPVYIKQSTCTYCPVVRIFNSLMWRSESKSHTAYFTTCMLLCKTTNCWHCPVLVMCFAFHADANWVLKPVHWLQRLLFHPRLFHRHQARRGRTTLFLWKQTRFAVKGCYIWLDSLDPQQQLLGGQPFQQATVTQ